MMRRFLSDTDHIYLACGVTDFRKQISGLVAMVHMQFRLDPYKGSCAFIFCNKKRNSIKILRYPLARQEKDWFRLGLVLPRNDMANWVVRCSEEWLMPVYDRIHDRLMECQVLHMDETRIQCNKEEGKKASSDSFMWVIRSAACERVKATFFHYSRTRNGDIAMKLLEQFQGYLITDAYAGYEKVDNITRALCWSHYPRSIVIPVTPLKVS